MQSFKIPAIATAGLVLLCAAPALTAVESSPAATPAQVKVTIDGTLLVTPAGMSLYFHSLEDTKAEKFAWQCTDLPPSVTNDQQSGIGERPAIGFKLLKSCIDKFPAFVAGPNAKPAGEFSIVVRPDGTRQWAYRNLPLYTSIKDRKPGDHNGAGTAVGGGAGRGGFQLASVPVAVPMGLKISRRAEGLVLATTENDRAVYTPRDGKQFVLASMGREDFKPIVAPVIALVSGDWSIVSAATGIKQYAFRGKPLYAAPANLNEMEIAEARGWEPVVVQKAPTIPAAIGEQLTLQGHVFTDKNGRSLYTYNCNAGGQAGAPRVTPVACDDPGDPAAFMVALCGDGQECARRWKPYIATANARPEGEFSIVDITYPMFTDMRGKLYPSDAPRVKAWAYRGKPLFTYYEDEKPGDMWGNGVGGIWGSNWTIVEVPGRSATQFEP